MSDTEGEAEPADEADAADEEPDLSHLEDAGDGCGCEEVWAHTAARRGETDSGDGADAG